MRNETFAKRLFLPPALLRIRNTHLLLNKLRFAAELVTKNNSLCTRSLLI